MTLTAILGKDSVKGDIDVTSKYAVDNAIPKAVVFPVNTKQIAEVVKYANQEDLAIVPWGSGSKMAMGNPPKRLDIVVCTSRMNHITDMDMANLTITVEAGVKFSDIQESLKTQEDRCYLPLEGPEAEGDEVICSDRTHKGCFLPIDPLFSDRATIGGVLACNSSGPRRLLYGLPRDIVLGVRFVTPSGEIVGAGGKTVKNVSGYDISKLMIGSAGTLGVLCEMTMRLLPLPERMETLLVSFDSLSDANAFADRIFESSLLPAAVEILNRTAFAGLQIDRIAGFKAGAYVVAVALEAFEEAVKRMHAEIPDMTHRLEADGSASLPEEEHRLFWHAVSCLETSLANRFSNLITVQLNYPISERDSIMKLSVNQLSAGNIDHTILSHAGSGICLIGLLTDRSDTVSMSRAVQAIETLLKRCLETGGNLLVKRAPTAMKGELPMWGVAGSDFPLMKRVKEQIDPSGIMNPGRFVGGL